MKLRELITRLQAVEEQLGGEPEVHAAGSEYGYVWGVDVEDEFYGGVKQSKVVLRCDD